MTANVEHQYLTTHQRTQLAANLRDLTDWIADELDDTLSRQSAHGSGPRVTLGKAKDAPLPFHAGAAAVARNLSTALNRAITHATTQRHYPHPGTTTTIALDDTPTPWAPQPGYPKTFTTHTPLTIKNAATWLTHPRHLIALSLTEHAATLTRDITDHIADARRIIEPPRHPDYIGACSNKTCRGDMWAHPEDTLIPCSTCGAIEHRDAIAARVDAELRSRLFTARELVTIVADRLGQTITPKTVYSLTYRSRRPITIRGTTIRGDHLYRCGDVLDALTRRPRRRTPRKPTHDTT